MLLYLFASIVTITVGQHITNSTLSGGGIISIHTKANVILENENVIITIFYNTKSLYELWDNFIEIGDALASSVEHTNCIADVIADARANRMIIRQFLNAHMGVNITEHAPVIRGSNRSVWDIGTHNISKKNKRQAMLGIITGLTNAVTLGLTAYELHQVNKKITDIHNRLTHSEGKLHTLSKATDFNTKQINKLIEFSRHTVDILGRYQEGLLNNSIAINMIKQKQTCISLKLSYIQLGSMVEKVMGEFKEILDYKFKIHNLAYNTRKEICQEIKAKGFNLYGDCLQFNIASELEYVKLANKVVILVKIPIRKNVDRFFLRELVALPIRLGEGFYKLIDIPKYVAIGKTYITQLELHECQSFQDSFFCQYKNELRNVKDSNTCLTSIINNSSKILELCRFKRIDKMDDVYLNINGIYYYSLNTSKVFEILCMNDYSNGQVLLKGVGTLKLRNGCFAKFQSILLQGSNSVKLNTTFNVTYIPKNDVFNFTKTQLNLLKLDLTNISKSNLTFFKNGLNGDSKYKHYYKQNLAIIILYAYLTIVTLIILVVLIRKHYHKKNVNLRQDVLELKECKDKNIASNKNTKEITVSTKVNKDKNITSPDNKPSSEQEDNKESVMELSKGKVSGKQSNLGWYTVQ